MRKEAAQIEVLVPKLRPKARFVHCTHSDDFIDGEAGLKDGFFFVKLYDERIDSNVIQSKDGIILIDNSYLSSFAYNLQLCRLFHRGKEPDHAALRVLFKHNFKKFFAEQLYHFHNNIFSRSILLETLLYEESLMVPVFEEREVDMDLDKKASLGSQIMSNLVMYHEFGHYILNQEPSIWQAVLDKFPQALPALYQHVSANYPEAFVTEFKCDVLAVINTLEQQEKEAGRAYCIDSIAFGFWVFAVLSSLTKSAKATAKEQRGIPDEVDFASIENRHRDYTYQLGKDIDFIERAKLVSELCRTLALQDGNTESSSYEHLVAYIDLVMDNDDPHARRMSLLAGEALHNHPDGMSFLYLRSKTYVGNTGNHAADT